MESVIFWTTLSAVIGCKTTYPAPKGWLLMNGNKLNKMKEAREWFTIKLDNKAYPVFRIVQADESIVFIAELEERKVTLYRGENDAWIGDADQELIDKIGKLIEEA